MKRKLTLILIMTFMIVTSCVLSVQAAVGNYSGTTRDSSDYDSGSSSSSSSSSRSYSSRSYDSSSRSYSSDGDIGIGGIIFLIIVFAVFAYMKKNNLDINKLIEKFIGEVSKSSAGSGPSAVPNRVSSRGVANQVREKDPNFSESKFIEWSNEVFITMQQAWTKKDWKMIRPFEAEALFRQHQLQLQEYIDQNRTNVVSNICITSAALNKYTTDEQYEYLTVRMEVNMHDYIIDDSTKQVLERDPNETYYSVYDLVYMRSIGVTTNTGTSNMSTTNCPNCGAPTQITSAGECEYCHSVITTGQHDWVLCQLKYIG